MFEKIKDTTDFLTIFLIPLAVLVSAPYHARTRNQGLRFKDSYKPLLPPEDMHRHPAVNHTVNLHGIRQVDHTRPVARMVLRPSTQARVYRISHSKPKHHTVKSQALRLRESNLHNLRLATTARSRVVLLLKCPTRLPQTPMANMDL